MPIGKKWTEKEDQIIRDKYPRYGTCIQEHLPGRSCGAIKARASALGIGIKTIRKSIDTNDSDARKFAARIRHIESSGPLY